MSRSSSFSRNHPYAKTRGWVSPTRAASALPTVTDGVNEVDDASEIWVSGGTVDEPEEGVARISFGGQSVGSNSGGGSSAALPVRMFNSSGVTLIPGDVVVTDPAVDSGVTTTSTASNTRIAGIVQAPINVAEYGPVLFNGFASVVNTTGAVSRGSYALTSATAKLAGSTAARVAGSFGVYLTGTDFPDFATSSVTTEQDVSTTSLDIDMPASIPVGRVLFLALWLESGTSAVSVDGWTLIGSETGFYYYTKFSEGDDTAEPTWTTASVAVATVLLLHESVSLAVPVEAHDYDTSTSAAAVSGLDTDYAHFAIAGVQAAATPGSGFVRLGGGTAGAAAASGTPTLIQSNASSPSGTSFSSAVTDGNVMVAIPFKTNDTDTWEVDPRQGGTCPVDVNMAQMVRGVNTSTSPGPPLASHALGIQAKVISDGYGGPFQTNSACDSSNGLLALLEFSNTNVIDYDTLDDVGYDGPVDVGTFAGVGADDLVVMAIVFSNSGEGDPIVNVGGFTQVIDQALPGANGWTWVGYKVGNGACSVTLSNGGGQDWAAGAVKMAQAGASVSGTLAGKYLDHASTATSPFTGGGAQNDGIFAVTLNRDARASALLYGPDLGAGGSALSIGSNSTDVASTSGLGGETAYSPSSHHHRGVRQISHASNTFVGDITLTASGTLGITMPTPGTINLSATGGAAAGGAVNPSHTAYNYLAASLEPLAIERLYSGSGTLRTAGASETLLVVNAFDTDLGSGRWEIRDPRHPLMPIRDIALVGNSASSTAVLLAPAAATYADAWDTYHDRIQAIYETKPLYLPITAASTVAQFLPGPYGSIITSVNIFDGTWIIAQARASGPSWNLHDEQGDAAAQAIRFAHPTMIPVSKLVATRLLTGVQDTVGASPDIEASITYFNCTSTWGKVTDSTSYDFRDDFMGTSLDTATKWTRTQSTAGNVEIQTTAGVANWLKVIGNGSWSANYIISQTSVARASGKILQVDVLPTTDSPNLIVGWHDGAGGAHTDFSHCIDFTTDGANKLQVFENGNDRGYVGSGYTAGTLYRLRFTLDSAGANTCKYEIQGGTQYQPFGGAAWSDITPGTTSSSTSPVSAGVTINDADLCYLGDVKIW